MRILYILASSWGGIPHYTAELANAISKYCEVIVLKPKDSNDKLFSERVKVINAFKPIYFSRKHILRTFYPSNLLNIYSFKNIKLINDIKPDIVHLPEQKPSISIFTSLYKLHRKYSIVSTLHATYESPLHLLSAKNFVYGLLESFTELMKYLVRSDIIIVHTLKNKNILIKRGINPKKIVVIPHGAYTFFKKYMDRSSAESQENCILFFGYMGENKGIEYLIKAVPIISQEVPDFKVIIAGEGNFSKYSNLIKDWKKFEVYNEFIPNEKVPELFRRAKLIVLPYTYHQGHSGVLTIAFSFGKPVVVTNVGSLPELVKNEREGLVVPPRDPKALADAIIKILDDDKLRKKMSRNALKKAEELSWDKIAKKHIKVYEEVIEGKNR